MSGEPVDADLRAAFELHRSRVLRLKHKCLAKLFESHEISPDTTDPEELDIIRCEEWPYNGVGHLSHPVKSSADLYSLIDDGTKPPLSEEERLKIFAEIEAILQERAVLDSDPLTLPEDFKRLCALTNSLKGPGLPMTNSCIPDAFDGLRLPMMWLRDPDEHDDSATAFGLECLHYKPGVMLCMGGIEGAIGGGCWLCWCSDWEGDWSWKWALSAGYEQPPQIFEGVEDLLGRYCETYLDVVASSYDDDVGEGIF